VCQLRVVRPELDGKYLRSLGCSRAGDGRILDALRDALLDGEIKTREEQEAFVKAKLSVERESRACYCLRCVRRRSIRDTAVSRRYVE